GESLVTTNSCPDTMHVVRSPILASPGATSGLGAAVVVAARAVGAAGGGAEPPHAAAKRQRRSALLLRMRRSIPAADRARKRATRRTWLDAEGEKAGRGERAAVGEVVEPDLQPEVEVAARAVAYAG